MSTLENIKQNALKIASCGPLGEWPGGSIIASVYAFFIIIIGKGISLLNPMLGYISFIAFIALSIIIIWLALDATTEKDSSIIILDKIVGMCFVLEGLSFHYTYWKLLLCGFLFFHLLIFIKPFLSSNKIIRTLDNLPGPLGVVGVDIAFGILLNIILRLIEWLIY